jgi:hypothetical protein
MQQTFQANSDAYLKKKKDSGRRECHGERKYLELFICLTRYKLSPFSESVGFPIPRDNVR